MPVEFTGEDNSHFMITATEKQLEQTAVAAMHYTTTKDNNDKIHCVTQHRIHIQGHKM